MLLALSLPLLNPSLRKKDKQEDNGNLIIKLTRQFTLYDIGLIFRYDFLANINKNETREKSLTLIDNFINGQKKK